MKKTTLYFPKIISTIILLLIGFFSYAQTQTFNFSSPNTFKVPSGITTLQVEVWGGGGKGGTRTSNGESGGGGGADAPDGGGAVVMSRLNLGYKFPKFELAAGYSYVNFFDGGFYMLIKFRIKNHG